VRRDDDRPIELSPAGAKLPDDEGANLIGAGHHAAVAQAL
jgi:hypothetical protein